MSNDETCSEEVLSALENTISLLGDKLNEEKERSPCLIERRGEDFRMWETRRRILLDVCMVCWGLGTWLGVNGLYVQLPLLVERLPEGWDLPSSMVLAIQLANIGLVIYAVLKRLFPRLSDAFYIYGLLVIGTLSLLLNAFLYTETAMIGETERSVAYLTLTFFAALVGCTSSVLFYPYLRYFRDVYLTTYLVGEGLSGFIPSILALIQGSSGEPDCSTGFPVFPPPRFDLSVFLILLSCLSALSLMSFSFVHKLPAFQSERVKPSAASKEEEASPQPESLLQRKWIFVLILMGVLNALMNGVLPSIQTYSCLPYGRRAYHLAVTLGAMVNPTACLAGVWLKPVASRVLGALLTLTLVPLSYILATALLSPVPPLYTRGIGEALVILAWVWVTGAVSYARMWVYGWARRGGTAGMRACGASTQIGSALGSLLLFLLVNFTNIFVRANDCPAPALT